MSLFNIRKLSIGAALGLGIVLLGNYEVSAQSRRQIERERQRIEREQRRSDRERQQSRSDRGSERRLDNANFRNGYEQGFLAGQYDRRRRKYNQSNVYRGTGAYPSAGDPSSSDYIYRQGYLQGYSDGFYGQRY